MVPVLIVGLVIAFVYPLSEVVYRGQPIRTQQLLGGQWVLRSLVTDGQVVLLSDDPGITIEFDEEGMLSGSGGCNIIFGEYQASGEYTISAGTDQGNGDTVGLGGTQIGVGGTMSLGPIAHTERACLDPPGRMETENQFFAALGQVTLFQVTSESLKLFDQDEPSYQLLVFGLDSGDQFETTVTWEQAIDIISSGEVEQVAQTHDLQVTLYLKSGAIVGTTEPVIDAIFNELYRCGEACEDVLRMTE